jgi:hypothetical protein
MGHAASNSQLLGIILTACFAIFQFQLTTEIRLGHAIGLGQTEAGDYLMDVTSESADSSSLVYN